MNDELNSYTNQRLPHFFKYAKGKSARQVVDANKSFVNKLDGIIPNPRINFRSLDIGKIDYTNLMHDPDIEFDLSFGKNGRIIHEETDPLIVAYCEFDRKYYLSVDMALSSNKTNKNDSYIRSQLKHRRIRDEIRNALSKFGKTEDEIVDILVKYLYENNRSNKSALWLCYGDIIYQNLSENVKKKTKEIQCVDCGEWFEVNVFDSATCRCDECKKEHEKILKRERNRRAYEKRKANSVVTL